MTTSLPTRNEAWGFYGGMAGHATTAWPLAFTAIAEATSADPEVVRAFLDSRHGRYFADTVVDRLSGGLDLALSIEAAVATWLAWTVSRTMARHYGIPAGTPYLTGFVIQAGIEQEHYEKLASQYTDPAPAGGDRPEVSGG